MEGTIGKDLTWISAGYALLSATWLGVIVFEFDANGWRRDPAFLAVAGDLITSLLAASLISAILAVGS